MAINVPSGSTRRISGTHNVGHSGITVNGTLVVEGDTRLVYSGQGGPDNPLINGNHINGTVRFENEGDSLIYDQTANYCGVRTSLGPGAQFGDNRGEIIFEGEVDLTQESGENPGFMLGTPNSGSCEINRVSWSHGAGHPWNGIHASDIGFCWAGDQTSDVTFNNCWIAWWAHNLFYWWRHMGTLTFNNCHIEHNGSRGINPPEGGLWMNDCVITIGGKHAGQLHSSSPGDPAIANAAFTVGGRGETRDIHLDNVHIRHSCTRCDGQQATYCGGGSMVNGWGPQRNGTNLALHLTDSHSDVGVNDSDAFIASGSFGSSPQCLPNPIENPAAYDSDGPGPGGDWQDDYDVTHIYEVENTSNSAVEYYLQVGDGDTFEYIDYNDAAIVPDCQNAFDDKAAGMVAPGETHCVGFDAELVDVTIDPEENANARVDGEPSSLSWYPQPGADGDSWKNIEDHTPSCSLLDSDPDDDPGDDPTPPPDPDPDLSPPDWDPDGDYSVTEHDDHWEYELHGTTRFWVDPGGTVSNVLIRCNGNNLNIQAREPDWTIRNLGIDGPQPDFTGAVFSLAATDGTTCRMENIYMGDGGLGDWRDKHQGDGREQPTGTFTFSDHTGLIEYINVYARNWTDNCFYNWNQGGSSGDLYWENCYVANTNISCYRIGNNSGEMHNCVAHNPTHRGIWVTNSGRMDVYNSDIAGNNQGTIVDHDGSLSAPNTNRVPDGCPTSAIEAATAQTQDDDGGTAPPPDDEPTDVFESWAQGPSALDKYEGSVDQFTVYQPEDPRFGDYSCRGDRQHGRILQTQVAGPERGDLWACSYWSKDADNDMIMFQFAVQSNDDRYAVALSREEAYLRFGYRQNAIWNWPGSAETSIDPQQGHREWCEVYVDFGFTETDTIEFWAEDASGNEIGRSSYQDTTFNSGGWGWSVRGDMTAADDGAFVDYLRLVDTESDDPGTGPDEPWQDDGILYIDGR